MTAWVQCDFIQITPTWADAECNIAPPAGGTSKKRKNPRLPRRWSEYQEPQPDPSVAMPMVPIVPGIIHAVDEPDDDDEVILHAIHRILH